MLTRNTDYERLRFIFDEFNKLKVAQDLECDAEVAHLLIDLNEFQKYSKIDNFSGSDRLPFEFRDAKEMERLIQDQCRPSNFSKILPIMKTSIARKGQTNDLTIEKDLKLKCLTYLGNMRQDQSEFDLELKSMAELLKIESESITLEADVNLAINSFFFIGSKLSDRQMTKKWIEKGIEDLTPFVKSSNDQQILSSFMKFQTLQLKVETSLILSANFLMTPMIQNWIDKQQKIEKPQVIRLFMQLFDLEHLSKDEINRYAFKFSKVIFL